MVSPIVKKIDGTMSEKSYAVVGKKGKIVLGIKPLGIQDGAMTGVPGKTYVFARLRSAMAGDLFEEDEEETGDKNVVAFKGNSNLDFDEAWPDISFNKKDSTRASGIFGAYIEGSISTDPEAVLKRLEEGGIIEKMGAAVRKLVGEENVVIRAGALDHWLHQQLDPAIEKYKAQLKVKADFQQHVSENLEEFEFHGDKIKELKGKHKSTFDTTEPDEMSATEKMLQQAKGELKGSEDTNVTPISSLTMLKQSLAEMANPSEPEVVEDPVADFGYMGDDTDGNTDGVDGDDDL